MMAKQRPQPKTFHLCAFLATRRVMPRTTSALPRNATLPRQVSNFDERLPPLLHNLGVYDLFDFILTSRECGSQKPDPHIFREALKRGRPMAWGCISGTASGKTFWAREGSAGTLSSSLKRIPATARKTFGTSEWETDVPVALGIARR